jgi:hypothetical protein
VFAKAGVHSQQELIDKLRRSPTQTKSPLR